MWVRKKQWASSKACAAVQKDANFLAGTKIITHSPAQMINLSHCHFCVRQGQDNNSENRQQQTIRAQLSSRTKPCCFQYQNSTVAVQHDKTSPSGLRLSGAADELCLAPRSLRPLQAVLLASAWCSEVGKSQVEKSSSAGITGNQDRKAWNSLDGPCGELLRQKGVQALAGVCATCQAHTCSDSMMGSKRFVQNRSW